MEDREQPFAAFVLETLTRQSTKLGQWWAERVQLTAADSAEPDGDAGVGTSRGGAARLVRTLLAAAAEGPHRHDSLLQAGAAMGVEAHRRNASLHLMLKEVDLLGALVLRAAEGVAAVYPAGAAGHEGLAVARRIAGATSQLRLAATTGYAQAIEDELRERYRAIRHELRNPLGTIKSAVTLLTDESVPAATRESRRVRAMVVRNTSSLDQMIGEVLGDAAARLRAFDTSREAPADLSADSSAESAASGREQRDDVARARQRPDLEPGTL
jgi:hypothetical protein